MTHEWADDTPQSAELEIRCVDQRCGWCGYTKAIQSWGSWTWAIEDCPWCLGDVERGCWWRDGDDN